MYSVYLKHKGHTKAQSEELLKGIYIFKLLNRIFDSPFRMKIVVDQPVVNWLTGKTEMSPNKATLLTTDRIDTVKFARYFEQIISKFRYLFIQDMRDMRFTKLFKMSIKEPGMEEIFFELEITKIKYDLILNKEYKLYMSEMSDYPDSVIYRGVMSK